MALETIPEETKRDQCLCLVFYPCDTMIALDLPAICHGNHDQLNNNAYVRKGELTDPYKISLIGFFNGGGG